MVTLPRIDPINVHSATLKVIVIVVQEHAWLRRNILHNEDPFGIPVLRFSSSCISITWGRRSCFFVLTSGNQTWQWICSLCRTEKRFAEKAPWIEDSRLPLIKRWKPMTSHTGWWYTYPSEKWWSSSVRMMKFPTYGTSPFLIGKPSN